MKLTERLVTAIENAGSLDALARPAQAFWSAALKPAVLRDALSGKQLGHPAHPALVQAAAGSLLAATALDLAGGTDRDVRALTVVGLIAAGPTIAAGWSDWLDSHGAEQRVGIAHAAVNTVGLSLYGLSWLQRRTGGGRVASIAGATVLGVAGWLGGHLAYAQGVGVDTTAFQSGPDSWTDIAPAADVTEALAQVTVDGVALLVSRVNGRPVVLEDRCTHRGAPLSDGERRGDCVVCPWHGSVFSLVSGDVETSPASRPQPVYQTRIEAGSVQARRAEPRSLRSGPV